MKWNIFVEMVFGQLDMLRGGVQAQIEIRESSTYV